MRDTYCFGRTAYQALVLPARREEGRRQPSRHLNDIDDVVKLIGGWDLRDGSLDVNCNGTISSLNTIRVQPLLSSTVDMLSLRVLTLFSTLLLATTYASPLINCESAVPAPLSDLQHLASILFSPGPILSVQSQKTLAIILPPADSICRPASPTECGTVGAFSDAAVDLCGAEMECSEVAGYVKMLMGECAGTLEVEVGYGRRNETRVAGGVVVGIEGGAVIVVRKAS